MTLVVTGSHTADNGDEDRVCADYLTAWLRGESPNWQAFVQRVKESEAGKRFTAQPGEEFDRRDLKNALRLDRFSFAMVAHLEANKLTLRPHRI